MQRSINIAVLCPQYEDATSFYRGVGPLAELSKQINIKLIYPNPVNWANLKHCDLVFMQRPSTPEHFQTLCLAKDMGLPIWVDMDDDNLSVPKDNQMYPFYSQMQVKEAIVKLIRHSDLITVSTEFLANKYSIYRPDNSPCVVIPNAIDDKMLHLRQIPKRPRDKTLLWRGTGSHGRNLKIIQDETVRVALENPGWRFAFFGIDPIDVTDQIKNFQLIPFLPIHDFYKNMCAIRASALYYSLGPGDHAQARSHVSWLEATFADTMTIASATPEFMRPGIINFTNTHEFGLCLEAVIKGDVDIDANVKQSWDCIQENYLLSKTNLLRKQVIESLVS